MALQLPVFKSVVWLLFLELNKKSGPENKRSPHYVGTGNTCGLTHVHTV